MANVAHSSLTGSSLHEPKGVASAAINTVYASDGAGSGAWTDMNDLVTATNFTTGDVKTTIKTAADASWVMMNDGTIGDALSSGTTRANDDCEDLFTLIWTNISDTYAAVSTGRGANAAADWAAHKTIALPKVLGRAMAGAGSGATLTARSMGETAGAETVTLSTSTMPAHTHSSTTSSNGNHTHNVSGNTGVNSVSHTHTSSFRSATAAGQSGGDFTAWIGLDNSTTSVQSADHTHSVSGTTDTNGAHTHTITTSTDGGGAAHANMQPSVFFNYMIKL